MLTVELGKEFNGEGRSQAIRRKLIPVTDFAHASHACRFHISSNGIDADQRDGGNLFRDGMRIATVAYDGSVRAYPASDAAPLFDPAERREPAGNPFAEFQWEQTEVEIHGHGKVYFTGNRQQSFLRSERENFRADGTFTDFDTELKVSDGKATALGLFHAYQKNRIFTLPTAVEEALVAAARTWHNENADGQILRNSLKDLRKEAFLLKKKIVDEIRVLDSLRKDHSVAEAEIEALQAEIESKAEPEASAAPRM